MNNGRSVKELMDEHVLLAEHRYEPVELDRGYANRYLRIDLTNNEITIEPVTQEMKDLWVGGKGFDLWLTFQEISRDTKWDSPQNPICFSPGPLGGTVSFPGSGKTLLTAISPLTNTMMDSNVGGYFGPYLKFAGFDALCIVGKAQDEIVIFIDAENKRVTVEKTPIESIDSHEIVEEVTEMYADDELDMRNIAVVSTGRGAQHARMGLLNFSFWDWRRGVPRLKQAGRGGIGTVFRDKKIKVLVAKNRKIIPAWNMEKSKVAEMVTPKNIVDETSQADIRGMRKIMERWGNDPGFLMEMMLDIQSQFRYISRTAVDELNKHTGVSKAFIYHCITFYNSFSLIPKGETCIQVCMGGVCQAKGAELVLQTLEDMLSIQAGQTTGDGKYTLEIASCLGACETAPAVKVNDRLMGDVSPESIEQILESDTDKAPPQKKKVEVAVKGLEYPVIMKEIDGTYAGFKKLMEKQTCPENIIGDIKKSALRGRGGGGYPTGEKWEACHKAVLESEKNAVLVCNSSVVEPPPHTVIEGMLIGALALNATRGFICFRYEHYDAYIRYVNAVEEAREKGFLGEKILGSDLDFDIELHRSAGGFITNESSALLQSISGYVGEPQPKYIHSAEMGYKNKPTIVCNIETWANISLIFEKGADWFKELGNGLGGSKVLLLSGDVKKSGIVEVALGTTLRELVDELGQGLKKKNRRVKALQFGGPSGGFLPVSKLDCKIDFKSLYDAGSIMGSGSVVVKDDRKCIVDEARDSVDFLLNESCGKCTPCREGLFALSNTLNRICKGNGEEGDIEFIKEIAKTMKGTSLCRLGSTAANPVLSMTNYFLDELKEHILIRRCRAGVCKPLITFSINAEKCTGCTLCATKCPTGAISGEKKETHLLDKHQCIACGTCYDVCTFDAVEVK